MTELVGDHVVYGVDGWALRGHDGLITSGTVSLRPGRFDGGGMRYPRSGCRSRASLELAHRPSKPTGQRWEPAKPVLTSRS